MIGCKTVVTVSAAAACAAVSPRLQPACNIAAHTASAVISHFHIHRSS